ncbi:MAG: Tfp pilus assembly protein PilX [Gammaproteobacteria bacterium]|jgi:Tfp pilus assembly protein PilX
MNGSQKLRAPRLMQPRKQQGMALFVALVVLIGATLISVAAARTSIMELRMAGNGESIANTFQTALATIDYVISDSTNLPTAGPLNQPASVTLPSTLFPTTGTDIISATATRVNDCGSPPRARSGSSLMAYSAFVYEIGADLSRNESGQGAGAMTQGYMLLGPKC